MKKCAAIQMASSPNVEANLIEAERLIAAAADAAGAGLIVLPENFACMGMSEFDKLEIQEEDHSGPIQDFLARMAQQHSAWIVGGTVPMATRSPDKVRSSCLVFDDRGRRVARYDKIHLFDVDVPGTDEQHCESNTIEAGDRPVVFETPFGNLGVAICYDLRFPELFRTMLDEGMEVLAVPSAFTAETGAAHWELLVRTRAVENLCYVIAADQGGFHLNNRRTFGGSMIVDPWGEVVSRLANGAGHACAEIDLSRLNKVRETFPVLQHRRLVCQ